MDGGSTDGGRSPWSLRIYLKEHDIAGREDKSGGWRSWHGEGKATWSDRGLPGK